MGPDKEKIFALEQKMAQLGIKKSDIEEKFIKGSGRGGQKVNKAVSTVFLKHRLTGITVKCGKSRSQHLNRFLALRTLVEKIESNTLDKPNPQQKKIDKKRKQKARRRKKSLKKMQNSINE